MLCGNRSVRLMYLTTKYFDTVSPVKESTPQGILQDLIWYMYFTDDWNNKREGVLLYRQEGMSGYWDSSTPEEIQYTGGCPQCKMVGHCKLWTLDTTQWWPLNWSPSPSVQAWPSIPYVSLMVPQGHISSLLKPTEANLVRIWTPSIITLWPFRSESTSTISCLTTSKGLRVIVPQWILPT